MATDIELLTTLADPYPIHAELRALGPHQLDDGRWIVATAENVERVLADARAVIGFGATDEAAAVQSRMARFTDGAGHASRREVANSALQPLDVDQLRVRAAEMTAAILATEPSTDIMATIARAVPVAVLATAVGFAESVAVDSAIELARAIAPPRGQTRGDAETALRRICAVNDPAVALTDTDINTVALLFQAVDATAGLIGNSVIAAARLGSPSTEEALDFVREVSRFDPAVHFTTRLTTATLELDTFSPGTGEFGTRRIAAGSPIVVDLAAAGRDPSRWDDPDEFRMTRVGASFAFGDGVHRCPGRDEALAIAAGAFAAIIATGGSLDLTDIAYEPRFNLRVPASLPWRSAASPAT
jgi:cytochrome P450